MSPLITEPQPMPEPPVAVHDPRPWQASDPRFRHWFRRASTQQMLRPFTFSPQLRTWCQIGYPPCWPPIRAVAEAE